MAALVLPAATNAPVTLAAGQAISGGGTVCGTLAVATNAVVDIVSYYKKDEVKSASDYECHAGVFVVGVALKGTFAKVAR